MFSVATFEIFQMFFFFFLSFYRTISRWRWINKNQCRYYWKTHAARREIIENDEDEYDKKLDWNRIEMMNRASLIRFEGDRWPSLERRRERDRQQLLGFPPNPGSSSLSDPPRGRSFSSAMSRCIVKRAPEAAAFYFLGVRAPSVQRLKHCCLVKINELEVESALTEPTKKIDQRVYVRNSFRATPSSRTTN